MTANSMPLSENDPRSGKVYDKPLRRKVEDTVEHLVSAKQGTRRDYAAILRGISDKKSPLSIDLLNEYVHNRFVTPKTHDLLASWDDSRLFFERLWT
jgi:hypothetical protein